MVVSNYDFIEAARTSLLSYVTNVERYVFSARDNSVIPSFSRQSKVEGDATTS